VELSRQVITFAKQTPQRAWLGEVSAVALQQSLADLDRAYRNYFRDLQRVKAARARGEHAKLRVGKPRCKSRQHNQAVRFTLNSRFRVLADGRLSLPKVGRLKLRWSRSLPAAPSSVTITWTAPVAITPPSWSRPLRHRSPQPRQRSGSTWA
jgi:putative transposase